jgi:hypothetical protein
MQHSTICDRSSKLSGVYTLPPFQGYAQIFGPFMTIDCSSVIPCTTRYSGTKENRGSNRIAFICSVEDFRWVSSSFHVNQIIVTLTDVAWVYQSSRFVNGCIKCTSLCLTRICRALLGHGGQDTRTVLTM